MSYANSAAYIVDIEQWRAEQETELRAPTSWLSLTGLFILQEGYFTVGSNPLSDILLPESAPDHLGIIAFSDGKARLNVATDEPVFIDGRLIDGQPLREAELIDNGDRKQPTLVTVGTVTFHVHKFGDQFAIRVKDSTNPAIEAFSGREWFAIKPEYRLHGRFIRHDAPRSIPIKTIVDTNSKYRSVGTLEFRLHDQPLRLLATEWRQPNQLMVSFRDGTSGVETYGPTRFLIVEVDEDGRAIVDFNQATNPPCAFTLHATCPLPPSENILTVPIEAGERYTHAKLELPALDAFEKVSA